MNITSTYCKNNIRMPYKSNTAKFINNNDNADIFIRSGETENSDNYSYENFELWAQKHNFLDNIKNIVDESKKILGCGFEGITYEISGTDKWVLKQYKRTKFIKSSDETPKIIKIDDISPKLNIGQPVALVEVPFNGNYSQQYWILKKQTGKTYGVAYEFAHEKYNDLLEKNHLDSLRMLSKLPQKAFDKCIKDVAYITKQGYAIDFCNPNNIMIDEELQEIHFVDINDKHNGKKEQFAETLCSLLDADYGVNFNENGKNSSSKKEACGLSEIIIKKFFTAMKKQNVQFYNLGYINSLLNTNMLNGHLKSNTIEDQLKELEKQGLLQK